MPVRMPAFLPSPRLRAKTIACAGPGVKMIAMLAAKKASRVVVPNIFLF